MYGNAHFTGWLHYIILNFTLLEHADGLCTMAWHKMQYLHTFSYFFLFLFKELIFL